MQVVSQVGLELSEMPWSQLHLQEAWPLVCLPPSKHDRCKGLFYQALDNSIWVMPAIKARGQPT